MEICKLKLCLVLPKRLIAHIIATEIIGQLLSDAGSGPLKSEAIFLAFLPFIFFRGGLKLLVKPAECCGLQMKETKPVFLPISRHL